MTILRQALQEQYHAGLAMLADCVAKCPDDLWESAPHPPTPWRTVWRIALHAVYFTHLYLGQSVDDYQPWPARPADHPELWQEPWDLEPYELPPDAAPYTQRQVLDYAAYVDSLIDPTIAALNLEAPETGIPWYPDMTKLSHELLNLRHLQGHVGQLSELLMARGIDTDWIGKRRPAPESPAR